VKIGTLDSRSRRCGHRPLSRKMLPLPARLGRRRPPPLAREGRFLAAAAVHSPEVSPDGRWTFAFARRTPRSAVTGIGQRLAMEKNAPRLWTATTAVLKPDIYSYSFSVDGLTSTTPETRATRRLRQRWTERSHRSWSRSCELGAWEGRCRAGRSRAISITPWWLATTAISGSTRRQLRSQARAAVPHPLPAPRPGRRFQFLD